MFKVFKNFYIVLLITALSQLNLSCASTVNLKPEDTVALELGVSEGISSEMDQVEDDFAEFDEEFEEGSVSGILVNDPLEFFNRAMFLFNDKLYYWMLKPISAGYGKIIPKGVRVSVRRIFVNLATPVRFVNCLLQLKFKSAGVEIERFLINSTIGVAGIMDPAQKLKLYKQDEDFSQTLGFYGLGQGFYLNLPFLGPSSLRDVLGMVGDYPLNPIGYVTPISTASSVGIETYSVVNETSLNITLYDDLVTKAFDPYVFMKSAYSQIRENKVKE